MRARIRSLPLVSITLAFTCGHPASVCAQAALLGPISRRAALARPIQFEVWPTTENWPLLGIPEESLAATTHEEAVRWEPRAPMTGSLGQIAPLGPWSPWAGDPDIGAAVYDEDGHVIALLGG